MTSQYIANNLLAMNEYLLIIQPDASVTEKVNSIKKGFATKYECPQAVYSKPYITLINFIQLQMNEQRIIGLMKNIIGRHSSIHITINGFGSFPTHTIYANIETKNSIVDMVKSLKPIQALLKIDKEHKPHYITEPHLTIARKLLPWQYEKGWLEYSNTAFTAGFMATEVLLLRRNVEGGRYTTAASFKMQGLGGFNATQASLFI
jgi:2'-5' RNA ligase